jgi:hypothetical protein
MIKNYYQYKIIKNPDWQAEQMLMARGEFSAEYEIGFEKGLRRMRELWLTYGIRPERIGLFQP